MGIPYKKLFVMYPPRPDGSTPPEDMIKYPGWWAQRKFNGTRTLVLVDPDGTIHLRNRHQEPHRAYQMTYAMDAAWADLRERGKLDNGLWQVFDAELLHSKTTGVKDRMVLFDALVLDGRYLTGTTYQERYERLRALLRNPDTYETTTGHELALAFNEYLWFAENHTYETQAEADALFRAKTEFGTRSRAWSSKTLAANSSRACRSTTIRRGSSASASPTRTTGISEAWLHGP